MLIPIVWGYFYLQNKHEEFIAHQKIASKYENHNEALGFDPSNSYILNQGTIFQIPDLEHMWAMVDQSVVIKPNHPMAAYVGTLWRRADDYIEWGFLSIDSVNKYVVIYNYDDGMRISYDLYLYFEDLISRSKSK